MNYDEYLTKELIDQIKEDEGFSPLSFWDIKQYSWGYGTKAPGANMKITKKQAVIELKEHLETAVKDYIKLFENKDINKVRREALINMLYNIGLTSFLKFRKMNFHLNKENINWDFVAHEAMDSKWYKQVGNRSKRIVKQLREGK